MDYLPASVHKWIEGSIVSALSLSGHTASLTCWQDPHSQQLIETYSQTYLIVVTVSFSSKIDTDRTDTTL
jgi:hypothetical protein